MYCIYGGELSQSCIFSLVGDSVTESFLVSRLVNSEGLLNRLPFPSEAPNIFPNSSKSLTDLCQVLGCRCLHLFYTGAGWLLSEDNYAKLLFGSIRKYFLSNVRDWCLAMGWVSVLAGYSFAIYSFSVPSFHLHFS